MLAECAARTEIARAGIDEARRKQEEAIARQEAVTAEIEKLRPRWEKERAEFSEWIRENSRKTDAVIAELKEHQDERRALLEALFKVMDRLDQQPPPPPNLRSA